MKSANVFDCCREAVEKLKKKVSAAIVEASKNENQHTSQTENQVTIEKADKISAQQ